MTDEPNEIVVDEPDYTEYLTSIEQRLEGIQNDISDYQNALLSNIESLREEIDALKTESFLVNEDMQTFVKYANITDIANLLFGVIIMLGLIFGALVFRHFRK